jgi:PadR family transcriptional regulator, regulatory protein PadR
LNEAGYTATWIAFWIARHWGTFPRKYALLDYLGEFCYISLLDAQGEVVGKQIDLLQGTLDMLILKAVSLGPLHGYGVLLRIQQISDEQLEIQQGSLYPALYRLEHQGLIASEWGESDNKRKAKFYSLTATGRRQLHAETEKWNRMASLIASILSTKPEQI